MSGLNNGLPQGFTLDFVFKWRYVSGNINYVMDWVCKLYVYIITERKRERERERGCRARKCWSWMVVFESQAAKIDNKEDKVTKHQQICGSYSTLLWAIDHFRWMWYLPPQVDSLAAGPSSAWARPIRYLGGYLLFNRPVAKHLCGLKVYHVDHRIWSLDLVTLSPSRLPATTNIIFQ